MANNTPVVYKKSRSVVVFGGVIAALTFMIDSLQALFKDNPQVVLILSVVGIIVAGMAIFQSRVVESETVPLKDAAVYIDQSGNAVAGPAAPLPDATPVSMESISPSELEAGVNPEDPAQGGVG